jgi:hypothetical protein
MRTVMRVALWAVPWLITGTAYASPACKQASYIFGKMSVGAIQCNLRESDAMPGVRLFLEVMDRACHGHDDRAAEKAAGYAIYDEIKARGRAAVCARISSEFMSMKGN